MRLWVFFISTLFTFLTLGSAVFFTAANAGTLLVKNARVHTLASETKTAADHASWFTVADGRISSVGTEKQSLPKGPFDQVIDAKGRTILPAFHDNHTHPIESAVEYSDCLFYDAKDKADLFKKLVACDKTLPSDAPWFRGSGWSTTLFPGSAPDRKMLDNLGISRPMALLSSDGHSYWLNSKGLAITRATETTQNPDGGTLGRDRSGRLTGVFYESAKDFVTEVLPKRTPEELEAALLNAVSEMHQNGIVSFKDASVYPEYLDAYASLDRAGKLKATAFLSLHANPKNGKAQISDFMKWRERYSSTNVKITTIKIFLDGVLEDGTAALLNPYHDKTDKTENSETHWSANELTEFITEAQKRNFQVHIHAIGDGAVRTALDSIESAQRQNGYTGLRHEIAHLQLVDPTDWIRFKALDVTAVFSPLWATNDEAIEAVTPLLGPARSQNLYPIGGVFKSGGRFAFGSDWSVTSMNPLEAIQTAVTRKSIEANPRAPSWLPEQCISRRAAINGYTRGGAIATFRELDAGTLEVGKTADFTILSQDPFSVPAHTLASTRVLETYWHGTRVFKKAAR